MWVKIQGFEEYLVNQEGQVFSTKSNKVLKNGIESWGYEMVNLRKNGKPNPHKIHKIVAETFLGPRPEGFQVNHIDGVKTNNHISNLEYCTPKQNSQHAYRMGLSKAPRGEKHGGCRLSEKAVLDLKELKGQMRPKEAAAIFGVSTRHARDIWNGKRRKWG